MIDNKFQNNAGFPISSYDEIQEGSLTKNIPQANITTTKKIDFKSIHNIINQIGPNLIRPLPYYEDKKSHTINSGDILFSLNGDSVRSKIVGIETVGKSSDDLNHEIVFEGIAFDTTPADDILLQQDQSLTTAIVSGTSTIMNTSNQIIKRGDFLKVSFPYFDKKMNLNQEWFQTLSGTKHIMGTNSYTSGLIVSKYNSEDIENMISFFYKNITYHIDDFKKNYKYDQNNPFIFPVINSIDNMSSDYSPSNNHFEQSKMAYMIPIVKLIKSLIFLKEIGKITIHNRPVDGKISLLKEELADKLLKGGEDINAETIIAEYKKKIDDLNEIKEDLNSLNEDNDLNYIEMIKGIFKNKTQVDSLVEDIKNLCISFSIIKNDKESNLEKSVDTGFIGAYLDFMNTEDLILNPKDNDKDFGIKEIYNSYLDFFKDLDKNGIISDMMKNISKFESELIYQTILYSTKNIIGQALDNAKPRSSFEILIGKKPFF